MNNEKLVSVVVPVYNVEPYIEEMLECLVNQTYKNLQIIIVNDGSVDNSAEIVKKYAEIDSRIEFYSQENKGVSAARNLGISKIKGEKLFFFDPDDTFSLELIEKCINYSEITKCSSVLYGMDNKSNVISGKNQTFYIHGKYYGKEIGIHLTPHFIGNSFDDINQWIKGKRTLREGREQVGVCRIMIDVKALRKCGVKFDKNLSIGEDTKFINEYMLNEKSISVLEETLYYMTMREDSANHTSIRTPLLMTKNKLKLIKARKEIDQLAKKQGIDTKKYWEGTMVLSAVQLAIRLSHNKVVSKSENKKVYRHYMSNPDVKKAIKDFSPAFGIKAIPFWFLKLHLADLLFLLCSFLPEKIVNKFVGV